MSDIFQYPAYGFGYALGGSTSAQLYGRALALEQRAERCRITAHTLDVRRAALVERHQPVVLFHTEAVWKGRAASLSRQHLRRVTGLSLHLLGVDLAATSRALLSEADALSQESAVLRRQAAEAAAAEAEAARVAAAEAEAARAAAVEAEAVRNR